MSDTPWSRTLDYGYPDMSTVDDGAWTQCRHQALDLQRRRIEQIAAETAPATVENVLHAFAQSGAELDRLQRAFGVVFAADGTQQRQRIRAEAAPELAAHSDWVTMHPGLFARLRQLQQRLTHHEVDATAEQRRYLDLLILQAEVAGAGLDPEAQQRLKLINQQLAAQESAYSRLQVLEAAESAVYVSSADKLAGLEPPQLAAAASAAQQAGYESGYLLHLTMPVQQAALGSLTDRQTRKRLHTAAVSRGTLPGDDGATTRTIAGQIAVLRAQKAQLLGYRNYLESVLPLRTAPDRAAVEAMLKELTAGAVSQARAEIAQISDHLNLPDSLEPWDVTFGLESVRRAQAESAEEGSITVEEGLRRIFDAAHRVYGLEVIEREDLPGFVPAARSFEVFDGEPAEPGEGLGLFLLDLYTRPTKFGGAWMNGFSVPSELESSRAVVTNNLNLTPPAEGQEARLSPREQKTLFHEFGHALHALVSQAEFAQLSGTAVPRDNVEFPSQVNEVFQDLYRRPAAVQHRLWGKGCSTTEHLAAVVIDLAWHTLTPEEAAAAAADTEGFEAQVLRNWGLDLDLVPPRYSSGGFKHIFASAGYAAGYYSYLWAEVLAADASQWFGETLDDDAELAQRGSHFRAELLARGNTRDPLLSYREALGRQPDPQPLLHSLGLT